MITDDSSSVDLTQPRTALDVVGTALALYGRSPVLFAVLALVVVAPYELVVLAVTHAPPLGQGSVSAGTGVVLQLLDFALIGPLVSALYVHGVVMLGRGERPTLVEVASRGLRVLPVVAAAQIVAGIGIGLGLLLLIVPGVILAIRWAVVAQAAAIERTDWLGALRRSGELARGSYLHVFGVILTVGIVGVLLTEVGESIVGTSAKAPQVVVGIAVATITRSFGALVTAVLFFDLVARANRRSTAPGDRPVP